MRGLRLVPLALTAAAVTLGYARTPVTPAVECRAAAGMPGL